jgi:hypothetical protein
MKLVHSIGPTGGSRPRGSSIRGNALIVTLALAACVGIVLVACLSLVKSQNQAVFRSQAWNACMPVIEAGIEEAMAHLNNRNETTYSVNGWTQNGVNYSRSRAISDGFFDVSISLSNVMRPVIVCTGYYRAPVLVAQGRGPLLASAGVNIGGVDYIRRAVEVVAIRQGLFTKAMVAKQRIVMNGNNIETDSFDSTDPNHSTTNGLYDPAKAKDNGDVATLSGIANAIGVGNANIKGKIRTGPGGSIDVGANGVVGSLAWHDAGNTGIQPGWSSDDMNMYFPDVEKPSLGGSLLPSSGSITGLVYKYVLNGGKYSLSSLNISSKERIAITGPSTLIVDGDVTVRGAVDIHPGGALQLYVGGDAYLGGAGINNSGTASNFVYLGLPTNTRLSLPSNGDFVGSIYAPSADFVLSGGGSTIYNFSGACVTRTISMNGHYRFHFDEALRNLGPWRDYVIVSWIEI